MTISANNNEAQKTFSQIYTVIAQYLSQPKNVKKYISRKLINLDAFIFTIEQLIGRLTVIRILEDTGQLPQPVLKQILEKQGVTDNGEEMWDDLLDLFLEIAQSSEQDNNDGVWSLSGVDELHVDNKTTKQCLSLFYLLDFSAGYVIVPRLEAWISEMSKAFKGGLENSFNKK
ncbi:MAG: hypothetical protein FH758_01775 [Firmicutes bacterium]|nr:hypothetical protein [Bacillota bacterium]